MSSNRAWNWLSCVDSVQANAGCILHSAVYAIGSGCPEKTTISGAIVEVAISCECWDEWG